MPKRNEAEMCEVFAESAAIQGWTPYPEIDGWDLLLVWGGEQPWVYNEDCKRIPFPDPPRRERARSSAPDVGFQIGIEAKRRANCEVLLQAVSAVHRAEWGRGSGVRAQGFGPDIRAVLVPNAGRDFRQLADKHLGLVVFQLPDTAPRYAEVIRWPERFGPRAGGAEKRHPLPPIVPRFSGGRKSPAPLSRWRIKALRLCYVLRHRGWVCRDDFRAAGMKNARDPTTWCDRGWVQPDGYHGRQRCYVAGFMNLPDVGFESERDELAWREDIRP